MVKFPDYTLFEMEPFVGQSTGDSVNFKLIDRLESIINFGIGLEFNFNEKVSAYASMASDYSAVPKEIKRFSELEGVTNNSIFRIDYYQFGGGFALNTKIVDITAGATYKGSSQEFKQTINFPPNEEPTNAKLFYSQWRFILGFSFPFANRFKEKVDGEL
jgi:hypothetical protein